MNNEQNFDKPQSQQLNIAGVKPNYSLEEVRILLEEQKKRMCFSLGLSSRSFHYPSQYDDIVEWMMSCPVVV